MKLTGIARQDLQALLKDTGISFENEISIKMKKDIVPDLYVEEIGRINIDTNQIESFFIKDNENKNTAYFDIVKAKIELVEKRENVFDFKTGERAAVVKYGIPYDIKESSRNKSTEVENYVPSDIAINGYYQCEYELLLTCGEATRRIIIPYSSVNVGMCSWMKEIEEYAEDCLHNKNVEEENPLKEIIEIIKDDDEYMLPRQEITMFNDFGENINIPINTVSEFMSYIVSVRLLSCEFIKEKEKRTEEECERD